MLTCLVGERMRDAAGPAPSGNPVGGAVHGVRPHHRPSAASHPAAPDPAAPDGALPTTQPAHLTDQPAATAQGFDSDHRDPERDLTVPAAPASATAQADETPAQNPVPSSPPPGEADQPAALPPEPPAPPPRQTGPMSGTP